MCTGVYVGKDVSKNGHTLIGRSGDNSAHKENITCFTYYDKNSKKISNGLEFFDKKLSFLESDIRHPYFSLCSFYNDDRHSYAQLSSNEYGVVTTATVSAFVDQKIIKYDPFIEGGLWEGVIPDVVAMSSKSAKEAIRCIAKCIDIYGNAEPNSLVVADKDEAWLVELYTGKQWAALKMPSDKVAVYGNMFMLSTEYVGRDSTEFMHSKNLFSLAQNNNFAEYIDGHMSLRDTYAGKNFCPRYSTVRAHFGKKILAPSSVGDYDQDTRPELFYKPDFKPGLKDVFEIYRHRYEGSEYSPEEHGRDDVRLIGTEAQYCVHVIEVCPEAPAEASINMWVDLANSENSIFLPYNNLVTDFCDNYRQFHHKSSIYDCNSLPLDAEGKEIRYNEKIAHVCFNRLCTLAQENRELYAKDVRDYWSKKECDLIEEYPKIQEKAIRLMQKDKQSAIDYINQYTIALQKETYNEANSMFDELMWYIMTHIETYKYECDHKTSEEIAVSVKPFKPTCCFV